MSPVPVHEPATGLRYTANNTNLYRKVLGKFADQQARAAEEISGALQAGDRELAQRLAHTLKGLAGSMGLPRLAETATALDAALKAEEDVTPLLTRLETDLGDSLQAVAAYLAG
jgi:HPt (histidine-containing phosphotransfer) domain-containing protein